jgi:glyoxylase-like metal-dependent hydrolase (beta-lactamase superfamily II)
MNLLPWILLAADLASGVRLEQGPVNHLVITRDGRQLAIYAASTPVEKVLFTHHRRDVVAAAARALEANPEVVAPAEENRYFSGAGSFWQDFARSRFHDYQMQTTKVVRHPLTPSQLVTGSDRFAWRGVEFEVLDTPGFTPGAVSYLFESGGKRFAATGDLIHSDGKLLDLYSLQDAVPGTSVRGYHGYAARAGALLKSLKRVLAAKPDVLIPARGPAIDQPAKAVALLEDRLRRHFRDYFAADALRWYWGDDNLRTRAKGVLGDSPIDWMPMAKQMPKGEPGWVIPIRTSRLLISDSGGALLIDCGYQEVIDEVKKLQREGRFRRVEAIYITHYHDDHTDFAQKAAGEFGVALEYAAPLREVLEQPGAFRLPALTDRAIRSSKPWEEGRRRAWHEFELTSYFFPGQTLHHGALLVEKKNGPRILFAGDSFTPSGIDDYCLWNRNLLGPGQGYFYCLRKLRELGPDLWVVNEHVDQPFRFTPDELTFMERSLQRRTDVLRELTPFDSPNFAVDEQWARFFPYAPELQDGQPGEVTLRVLNHSPAPRRLEASLAAPRSWKVTNPAPRMLKPGEEGEFVFRVTPSGKGVIPVAATITLGPWTWIEWAEALTQMH